MPILVVLWTDVVFFLLLLALVGYGAYVRRHPQLLATWQKVLTRPQAMIALVVLSLFVGVATLDSLHYRERLPDVKNAQGEVTVAYSPVVMSLLDASLRPLIDARERSYSSPLAYQQWSKETVIVDGVARRDFPRLQHGGAHLSDPDRSHAADVFQRAWVGAIAGALVALLLSILVSAHVAAQTQTNIEQAITAILQGRTSVAWRAALITVWVVAICLGIVISWAGGYHVLGTDATGNDVLYRVLKGIRTALVIGALTSMATLPFALSFGLLAGYFKSWVDDMIQYIYTTLSSVPSVLLIAACVLMMQVFIDQHPDWFPTSAHRADIRLFLLCIILGLTGWAGLCRLIRAETLKLRELEYVQAARAFGVSHARILRHHLLPNVMHVVLITLVLSFSSIVLLEAVLSYIGVGVDPQMHSFGTLINTARSEIARSPMIWWTIFAAFSVMLIMVLAANLLADAVRDAFDPRVSHGKPAWLLRRRFALKE